MVFMASHASELYCLPLNSHRVGLNRTDGRTPELLGQTDWLPCEASQKTVLTFCFSATPRWPAPRIGRARKVRLPEMD